MGGAAASSGGAYGGRPPAPVSPGVIREPDFEPFGSPVASPPVFAYLEGHGSTFPPHLQARIYQLVIETGRAPDKLVQDAMAGYIAELAETREMLNSRYDDQKSGRVKPIPGDEVEANFREKSAAARRSQPGS